MRALKKCRYVIRHKKIAFVGLISGVFYGFIMLLTSLD